MLHAVVTSCWATEYAAASVGLATPFSDATLNACVTPAPPGVTDVTFAIEFPPQIRINVWKVTGIPYAARKTPITARLAIQPTSSGTKTRQRYARGCTRMPPPSLASSHQRSTRGQARRARTYRMYAPPASMITVAAVWVCTNSNFTSNEPSTVRNR